MIGPSTVLPAGHVVDNLISSAIPLNEIRITPGRNGASTPLGSTAPASIARARNWVGFTPTDYSVFQLSDPIGDRIGFWGVGYRRGAGDSVGTSISAGPLPTTAGTL